MPASRYGEGSVYQDRKRDLWVGQILFGTQRRRVTARRKADMLVKLRALQAEKDNGLVHDGGTTGAWMKYWLEQIRRRVEPSTHADYTRWNRVYVEPHVGTVPLRDLSEEDVEAMMTALEAQGLSAKTVRVARSLLIQALDLAVRRDKVRKNVAKLTMPPRQTKAKIADRLDARQAQAVLKTLWGDRNYALAVLALSLGIRPGELYGLRWSAVKLKESKLSIRSTLKRNAEGWYLKGPKTDAGRRTLLLPGFVVEALADHQAAQKAERLYQRDGFVFCDGDGEPLDQRDVLAWWHDATVRAGVGRRRFYCSRHTAATLMLNNGVSLEVVCKILGHAGYAITSDVYAEVGEDLQRDAAGIIEDIFDR
jgi:integrase